MTATPTIKPRRVKFDWEKTPLHWVPGDAFTTHVINVLHLLLPAGEKWFCDVYRQALPFTDDGPLRDAVKGFIGQEAVHSRAHSLVLDHLAAQGLDTTGYTTRIDWMFERLLSDHGLGAGDGCGSGRGPGHGMGPDDGRGPGPGAGSGSGSGRGEVKAPQWLRRQWLISRLATVAAIEHFTCVLGYWAISASGALDDAGADATMLDLLRWHGAEEVEHRAVAFDVYQELSGSYVRRVVTMAVVLPIIVGLWMLGTRYLIAHDPEAGRGDRPSLRRFVAVSRRTGRLPTAGYLARAVPRYLRPSYHPLQDASTGEALAYLARSPAARSYSGT